MKTLNSLSTTHLKKNGIDYHHESGDDGEHRIIVHYSGRNTGMVCGIELCEEPRRLCMTIGNGLKASRRRMPAAYELIARMNTGLVLGAYWINPADGEIVFAVNASMIDLEPTDMWIGSAICSALKTYDRSCPMIANVLFADASPSDIFARLNGPSDDQVNETLEKLFAAEGGDSDEGRPEATGTESPSGQEADDAAKTPLDLWSPRIPRIIAKIAPEDIAEIQREIEGKDDHPDSEEADSDAGA